MDLQSFCYLPHEVFEGRNQSYGAYELRKKYNKTVTIILFAVIAVAVTTFAYPTIKRMLEPKEEIKKETTIVEETVAVDLVEEEPEEEKPQEKQEVTIQVPPPPQVDQTKFTVIEVTPEKVEVIKENKEIEEKETAVATETKEGEASPEKPEEVVVVEKPKENIEKAGTGEEENKTYNEFEVAANANFEGGINEFRKQLQKKIVYPSAAKRKETQGNVVLQFVIDTDGSITDIKVLKDIGDGCGEEAVKALQKMTKKWAPAKNAQGKSVKVRKTIPVVFKLEK